MNELKMHLKERLLYKKLKQTQIVILCIRRERIEKIAQGNNTEHSKCLA